MDPIRAALLRSRRRLDCGCGRRCYCPPRLAANAKNSWVEPFVTPASQAPALEVKERWAALLPSSIPMLGEEVGYVEPCDDC